MHVLVVQQLAWGMRVGHPLARTLQARGHTLSALVHGRETQTFLEGQTDVTYSGLWLADRLYDEGGDTVSAAQVREIEERYGLDSLWRVLSADRVLTLTFLSSRMFLPRRPVSNEYVLSVGWRAYRLVREIVDRATPDFVVAPVVGSLANYFLYLECRRQKIPFFTVAFTRFGDFFYVADDQFLGNCRILVRYEELRARPEVSPRYDAASRLYADIRRDAPGVRPGYARRERLSWLVRLGRGAVDALLFTPRVARALGRARRVFDVDNIWLPANSRWNAVKALAINLRERFVATDRQGACLRRLDAVRFDYVYFPLHIEPEVTLSVLAPEYGNQLEVCRRAALALPAGVRLLVKEHPFMVAARPRGYYQDLRGLPNVELIHSSVPSPEVFGDARCRAVLVISSTVGFEAAMWGRPVVLLGRAQFAGLPSVQRATSFEDAAERLAAICHGEWSIDSELLARENLAYLCAVLEESFSMADLGWWSASGAPVNAQPLVEAIERRLREGDA